MPAHRPVSATAGAFTSISCAKPSGTMEGDLLIAFIGVIAGNITPVDSWTMIGNNPVAGGLTTRVWWRSAGSSEPSSYVFNLSNQNSPGSNVEAVLFVVAVPGAKPGAPGLNDSDSRSGANVTTPSITPFGSDDLDIRCVFADISPDFATWTPPAGYIEQADIQSSSFDVSGCIATKQLSSGAPAGAQTFVCSTSSLDNYGGYSVYVGSAGFTGWGVPITI